VFGLFLGDEFNMNEFMHGKVKKTEIYWKPEGFYISVALNTNDADVNITEKLDINNGYGLVILSYFSRIVPSNLPVAGKVSHIYIGTINEIIDQKTDVDSEEVINVKLNDINDAVTKLLCGKEVFYKNNGSEKTYELVTPSDKIEDIVVKHKL